MMMDEDKELKKLIEDNMELRKVGEKIVEISREEEANGWYDEEEHQRKVRNTMMKTAIRDGWYKGKKEGIKEGRKQTLIDTAKNFLKQGIEKEIIAICTGLSVEDIDNIEN